ncbi:MAG: Flp family type IVb pilin [Candidatus Devosia phytovorans]|uniref:Flp family type IVb pilin n=1 Tax=Candidatus Devosia phytovorans TaxID=3121372 RepID=A0AAJ6AZY5_9HYPH|nr:Flp family type IVb pilin [Devosia sp.]WEK04627.1 MAG: Flp family type IVb pilin [Devosia sp.]
MTLIKAFFADESGATAMEYALVATLIGMTIIGTVAVLGDGLRGLFNNGSAETMANQTAKIR